MGSLTDNFEPHEKAFIVFRGTPDVWRIPPNNNDKVLDWALAEAKRLAEEREETHTILCIPVESLEIGLAAVYHGVVVHALDKVTEEEDGD